MDAHLDLVNELERLVAQGQGESAEAAALRERINAPWKTMTRAEISGVRTCLRGSLSRRVGKRAEAL